jgi:hypothetical protein
MIDVSALHLATRTALLTDGTMVPITNLYDTTGKETDDAGEAVSFVAGDGSQWFAALLSQFERAPVQ